jgi:integrase
MSSSNKRTKKNRPLYAEERRKQNRRDQEEQIKVDVEQELNLYFQEQEFKKIEHLEPFYPAVYEFIKRKAPSLIWKKYAHEFFRKYIQDINQNRDQSLALPSLTFDIQRDPPVITMDWIEKGHQIDEIIDKIWDYWVLAKDSQTFSDDEIIGNIVISAVLYSGLNQNASLEALLAHLKDPAKIRKFEDLNIIFLEPFSPSYGDLFVDEKTIRKSRNFIPDQITRLWLIHFNTRNILTVNRTVEEYLELIFNKIKLSFNPKTYKLILDYANFNWMQLQNVDIDPALSQCLIENNATCGLSEIEFERFLHPKFKYQQDTSTKSEVNQPPSVLGHPDPNNDIQQDLDNVIKIHKDLLQLIRTPKSDQSIDVLIIKYCLENTDQFNEYSKRIALWLISLYKPAQDQIKLLAERFNFCINAFQKSFQQNKRLTETSIYSYYCRIAEPWLTHSLQYLDCGDDLNTNIEKIYQQIITNTRLVDETDQLEVEFKKSKGQTTSMLKRFHRFQQIVFQAESLELESVTIQSRPRARIIGPLTYQAYMNKLNVLYASEGSTYNILKIIYILAYRTGMRINEILGLRVRDIEGLTCLSVWIQPYGSKKQGNLHQLKTDSAERKIPVFCLLKAVEYDLFHRHVVEQRLLKQPNLYLFRHWNQNSKLNKHTVTTPFRMIMNELFKDHDYSFHSFRHTTANHLSIVLNCDYAPLVKNMTDYTEEEYQSIRAELIRNTHGQNHWFIIAHLLGHIEPTETFKSYIHLSYLIAGYKLLQYHPEIDTGLAKKLMGYSPSFKFLNAANDSAPFNFKKYSSQLGQELLNDQTGWLNSNVEDILDDVSHNSQPHDFFKYFAGTKESRISFEWFFNCLNLLEIHQDPDRVSQELSLPIELVHYWYENATQLSQLKSQQNKSRLFNLDNTKLLRNPLKPAMIYTDEEKKASNYFFENIQKVFENNPDQIQAVLETFLSRVTASHTGIHYPWRKISQMESFYSNVKDLFPSKLWHLRGNDLIKLLDPKKQPLLLKLTKSSTTEHPSTQENFLRLQLYSTKDAKALAAFKFCLHLACIGRPRSIELKVKNEK